MKYILLFILLSTNLFAKGYYCSALCISVDGYNHAVDIAGEVDVEAGLNANFKVHRLLKKKCRQKFYDGSGILVDGLKYRGSYETSNSSEHHRGDYFEADGWSVLESYSISDSYSSSEHRDIDISIRRSNPDFACELDNDIPTGWIPYLGDIPVQ